jgi:hypothetical protein
MWSCMVHSKEPVRRNQLWAMEKRRTAHLHQRSRGHRQSANWQTARQGTAHVLDQARRPFASAGPMCRAQRRVARTLSTMVPSYRNTADRPTLGLGTPPFLTVPIDNNVLCSGVERVNGFLSVRIAGEDDSAQMAGTCGGALVDPVTISYCRQNSCSRQAGSAQSEAALALRWLCLRPPVPGQAGSAWKRLRRANWRSFGSAPL